MPSAPRSRVFVLGAGIYFALLLAAFASGNVLFDDAAILVLISVLLLAALRRGSPVAWFAWLVAALALLALGASGKGRVAVDALPVLVNIFLCSVFARTLRKGRQPLIARIIEIIEEPGRLALPRVADYARRLTQAWAWLLGAQAAVLLFVAACVVPDGWLASAGVVPPIAIAADWRWYLQLGSFAIVGVFLVGEYAFRRCYLRAMPHMSLVRFIVRVARCWPALVRSLAEDTRPA